HLINYTQLYIWVKISQHYHIRILKVFRDNRIKIGKDIEFGGQGIPCVQIVVVFTAPKKGLAPLYHFQRSDIDIFFGKKVKIFAWKVFPDYRDDSAIRMEL